MNTTKNKKSAVSVILKTDTIIYIQENEKMREFSYVITDPQGIHARPAGVLVKTAASFTCDIKITKGDKTVDAKRIMGVMSLGVKAGDEVTFTVEGTDEETIVVKLEEFMKQNL